MPIDILKYTETYKNLLWAMLFIFTLSSILNLAFLAIDGSSETTQKTLVPNTDENIINAITDQKILGALVTCSLLLILGFLLILLSITNIIKYNNISKYNQLAIKSENRYNYINTFFTEGGRYGGEPALIILILLYGLGVFSISALRLSLISEEKQIRDKEISDSLQPRI